MVPRVVPVILSGGAGTRLWPLSTPAAPKQFIELFGSSLFNEAVHRLDGLGGVSRPIVVSGESHLSSIKDALGGAGLETGLIILEPVGRNTAPAIAAAALVSEPDDILVVLPSDHLVSDREGFVTAVEAAVDVAPRGYLATFGVLPDGPETGYGYITRGKEIADGVFAVASFHEKPDHDDAARYVGQGALWNSGMFVFQVSTFLAQVSQHSPKLLESVESKIQDPVDHLIHLDGSFADVQSISVDTAVMERTTNAVVVPVDVGWSDVGSYSALLAASDTDSSGNSISGDVNALNLRNSYVRATSRRVSVAELDGVVVVETPDDVLVVPIEHSQSVRDIFGMVDRTSDS